MSDEKKEDILDQLPDAEELDAVTGAGILFWGAAGQGNCTQQYYNRSCTATVEKGSLCRSNDWCARNDEHYDLTDNFRWYRPALY